MENKVLVLILLLLTLSGMAFPEKVLVAPLVAYDGDGNSVELDGNPSENVYETISGYWFDGLLEFVRLPADSYGQIYTALDANRACEAENAEYILFGYVQKLEDRWFSAVKLYDCKSKKISREFFSADDSVHYGRFIENLCSNILEGIIDESGISFDGKLKERTRPFEARLPVSGFYWTPVGDDWTSRMTGIVGGSIGLHLFPCQPKLLPAQKLVDFSMRPTFSFSWGINTDGSYPLDYKGISFSLPVRTDFHFNSRNSIYAGVGVYYEIELIAVKPKYEDAMNVRQKIFGLEPLIGYEFKAGNLVALFSEVLADFHLNGDGFVALKNSLGISFLLGGGAKS
jgi:hypothetical protein